MVYLPGFYLRTAATASATPAASTTAAAASPSGSSRLRAELRIQFAG